MTRAPSHQPRRSPLLPRLTAALLLLTSAGLGAQDPAAESRQAAPEDQEVRVSTGPFACPGCDLEGFDFAGRDLTSANLAGANLRGADFRGAVLDGIVLAGADLENADFDRAQLDRFRDHNADLSRANLAGAVFRGAALHHTDFQYSSLHGTDFSGTDLTTAVLGPRIDAGVLPDGRKTSFREARLRRGFTTDATTMDLADVVWVDDPADGGDALEIACGRANLGVLLHRVYVGTDGEDSDSCGESYASPCKSIQQGIERCGDAALCGVLVAWGEYSPQASVALFAGINLYGGCVPKAQARPGYFSVIHGPEGGRPAIAADEIEAGTLVQGFHLVGSKGADPPLDWLSEATTALRVAHSTALTLADVTILAGPGCAGNPGPDGLPSTQGVDANGRIGGKDPERPNSAGGDGSPEMGVHVDIEAFEFSCEAQCTNFCYGYTGYSGSTNLLSAGGKWGQPDCTECPRTGGHEGHRGADGADGDCGAIGFAADNRAGYFLAERWLGSTGTSGGQGWDGAGGGGGGAGGYKAGACFWKEVKYKGNAGGGGGSGAMGSFVAAGGRSGGASFAVVLLDSTATFEDSRLVGGRSGDGGAGGNGMDGAKGGRGAPGATARGGGNGGHGGNGGSNGGSGGGGGGNSGPAVTVALVGNSQINTIGTTLLVGQAGTPGHGGKSGKSGNGAACPSPAGGGNSGLAVTTHQY